jgi:hypothetical protein
MHEGGIAMTITEKVAYLKDWPRGMALNTEANEGKAHIGHYRHA